VEENKPQKPVKESNTHCAQWERGTMSEEGLSIPDRVSQKVSGKETERMGNLTVGEIKLKKWGKGAEGKCQEKRVYMHAQEPFPRTSS